MKFLKYICLLVIPCFSCGPKIFCFKPAEKNLSPGDTIRLEWKARGKPLMLVHEKTTSDDPANIKPGQRLMEFILTFKNSEKFKTANVLITPAETSDTLFLRTKDLHADTILAYGNKQAESYFTVSGITSVMNRAVFVFHQNKVIVLEPGKTSGALNDSAVDGDWKLATLLLPAEKKDHSIIPSELKILVTKKHK